MSTGGDISVNNLYLSFVNKYLELINMHCNLKSKITANKTDKY